MHILCIIGEFVSTLTAGVLALKTLECYRRGYLTALIKPGVTPPTTRQNKKGQPRHRAAQSEKFGLQDFGSEGRFFAEPRVWVPGAGG